ncbi:hypothetical protein OJ997_23625 [Solirubrobacter phytolaccae]|uniref:Tetratricopeptide repeat protein n=1 Tax=Solirubrobacter phytolaccae TaxID=1404360 RepID=A0A9X3SD65_9ACTN|nr:hypothetical protein [Solirubrobacter phytolaccae]MDA0183320.1 hypothetical protein [Solirubrobacter phytolaccae]
MNIWAWVWDTQEKLEESGNERLAELIERLPTAALDDQNAEVEAIVPEALGLARSAGLPWVEIFIRHWHLQATGDGFEKVPYAVETLDFSHQDEHRACPQSVCTVQDLARAYSGADGPGYAHERLAVVEEALERIDPSWDCFHCMIVEKVEALTDLERHEEALTVAREGRAAAAAAGRDFSHAESDVTNPLLGLGRYEEALESARPRPNEKDDTFARWRRLSRADALIGLGRLDEALDELLEPEVALREPRYQRSWVQSVERLVRRGRFTNDWRLGGLLERMVAAQVERGRAWDGVRIGAVHGRLALWRGARVTAERALEDMRALAARLREPERAEEQLRALAAGLERMREREPVLPDTADAFLEAWQADVGSGPEQDLERLEAARRRWPDELAVAWGLHRALHAVGRREDALQVLRAFADAHADDVDAQATFGHALIDAGEVGEEVEALAERVRPLDELHAAWLGARAAYRADDSQGARELCELILERDPEALNARRLAALACEELKDFDAALVHRNGVLEHAGDEVTDSDHWDRLVPATIVGDWDAARESAAALDIELQSDSGPIDEEYGLVRLRFAVDDFVVALRTGPVSARVLNVGLGKEPQHAGDRVVFDAGPIGTAAEGELVTFPVVHVLAEGPRRAYPFDGVDPGDDAWAAFAKTLGEEGWVIDVRYSTDYELEVDGETCRGIYGHLAVPDDVSDEAAHARLGELTADWDGPFTWLPLAEAAGDEPASARQREHAEALALY